MSVILSDVRYRKSEWVSDTSGNGGRRGRALVASGVKHSLFPRVTRAQREAGLVRYRKHFWSNENADNEPAHDLLVWIEHPSTADDRYYLALGGQTDTQSQLTAYDPLWTGTGRLHAGLTAGVSTTVAIEMDASDYQFPNGGLLHVANKILSGQAVSSSAQAGQSVQYNEGTETWEPIAATDDAVHPKGIFLGDGMVFTMSSSTAEEWLRLADNLREDQVIGSGNGSNVSPSLTALSDAANGVCRQPGKLPVVTATCGGTVRTVAVAADGACSGFCSAGALNMATGAWATPITWSLAPDNGTDITITYRENCFSWSGSVATVGLADGVTPASNYGTSDTFAGGCIEAGDVTPLLESWTENNTSGGTFDETTGVTLSNLGTERDDWTIVFTGSGAYTCQGVHAGSVGGGATSANFAPINPQTGAPYFTLAAAGWSGAWDASPTPDSITFTTSPAATPLWLKQVVPIGCAAASNNVLIWGWQCE